MNAAIYCRISQDREGAGLGVERQRADCAAVARQRGWNVSATYVDNDVSAFSGKRRPEYRRMLHDIQDGQVDAIIAWHTDRLHRSPRELEEFIDICEAHHVHVETVRAGELDLKTPAGRAVARTLGAWARYESEHKSERVRRKKAEMASKGLPLGGGYRCYGYAPDRMNLVPHEADILREVVDRVLAGDTLNALCRDLNTRGEKTSTGGRWQCPGLRALLIRPRIAGISDHRTAGRVKAQWPAIVAEDKWTRVVAILTDPARRTRPGAPRRHLLSGLLRCGECGGRLSAHPRRSGTKRFVLYHCVLFGDRARGCGRVGVSAHLVEPYVVEAVLSTLEGVVLQPEAVPSAQDGADVDAHAADQGQLDELASLYATRAINAREWVRARSAIEDRITERNSRIADRVDDRRLRDLLSRKIDLRAAWPSFTVEQQRSILALVLDRVTVSRAATNHRRFDPERLTPVWLV